MRIIETDAVIGAPNTGNKMEPVGLRALLINLKHDCSQLLATYP
jgi:hypothetical protein